MNIENATVVFNHGTIPWLNSVQLNANTLLELGSAAKTLQQLSPILKKLTADEYLEYMLAYYQHGEALLGENWNYADLLTLLHAATKIIKPENYLEIGVRRGRSMAIVAATHPSTNIFGFDMWIQNYAGMENLGPEFATDELKNLGHVGALQLISGDSQKTIPKFFADNADLYFDLITVDGDHSLEGARIDMQNVLPRLKIGGILILDDICHPQHAYLEQVWDELMSNNPNFSAAKYTELGYGVACAVRKSF